MKEIAAIGVGGGVTFLVRRDILFVDLRCAKSAEVLVRCSLKQPRVRHRLRA
jgi:hypothetical protein